MFTKQEKNELYNYILNQIEKKLTSMCCYAFYDYCVKFKFLTLQNLNCKNYDAKIIMNELYELKTRAGSIVWFNNDKERIEALKKCIEMTK